MCAAYIICSSAHKYMSRYSLASYIFMGIVKKAVNFTEQLC